MNDGYPIWWDDCIRFNDCSKCPWGEKDKNGIKECERVEEKQ